MTTYALDGLWLILLLELSGDGDVHPVRILFVTGEPVQEKKVCVWSRLVLSKHSLGRLRRLRNVLCCASFHELRSDLRYRRENRVEHDGQPLKY